jgi:hypothetical protein
VSCRFVLILTGTAMNQHPLKRVPLPVPHGVRLDMAIRHCGQVAHELYTFLGNSSAFCATRSKARLPFEADDVGTRAPGQHIHLACVRPCRAGGQVAELARRKVHPRHQMPASSIGWMRREAVECHSKDHGILANRFALTGRWFGPMPRDRIDRSVCAPRRITGGRAAAVGSRERGERLCPRSIRSSR